MSLHQFRRHTLWHARGSLWKHGPALARQFFLGVEDIGVEDGGRIEILTSRKEQKTRRQSTGSEGSTQKIFHPRPQLLLAEELKPTSISTRDRVAAGVCRSVMIMSIQGFALDMSPERHAASTISSRAVWRKVRSLPVSGSSRARASSNEPASIRIAPARRLARSCKTGPTAPSLAILS